MKQALFSALAVGLLTAPTSTSVNCGSTYVGFLERLSHRAQAMPGERLAAIHRGGLRIFDACDTGHLQDVQGKFSELERRLGTPTDAN